MVGKLQGVVGIFCNTLKHIIIAKTAVIDFKVGFITSNFIPFQNVGFSIRFPYIWRLYQLQARLQDFRFIA